MKIVGQTYRRDQLERGDVFHGATPPFFDKYIVVSNDGTQRNKSYRSVSEPHVCVQDRHYYWSTPDYLCTFLGTVHLDEQDGYSKEELENPAASLEDPVSPPKEDKIKEFLDNFDFEAVAALRKIQGKLSTIDELKTTATDVIRSVIEDKDNPVWVSSQGFIAIKKDDGVYLTYTPFGVSPKLTIEPKKPECDGIRKLDLDD